MKIEIDRSKWNSLLAARNLSVSQRMEEAALLATAKAARRLKNNIRSTMQASNLGRLGNALGDASYFENGRGVRRLGGPNWAAAAAVYIRSTSARSRGAIEAYTEGADIRPRRGRWLWIATEEIKRIASDKEGKERMTPASWVKRGYDSKIGPLVPLESINGRPLLVVENVGVSAVGRPRSARRLNRNGRPAKGQRVKELVVAFYAIPATSRQARLNPVEMARWEQADLGNNFMRELRSLER